MATTAEGNPKNENKTSHRARVECERGKSKTAECALGARLALTMVGGDSVWWWEGGMLQLTSWLGGASSIPSLLVALLWLNLALGHFSFYSPLTLIVSQ